MMAKLDDDECVEKEKKNRHPFFAGGLRPKNIKAKINPNRKRWKLKVTSQAEAKLSLIFA